MMARRKYKTVNKPRVCDLCGEHYQRRNLVEGWTTQNPGHRAGWEKQRIRVCVRCAGAGAANRMIAVAVIRKAK